MKTTNSISDIKGFWDEEVCEYCKGTIVEKRVELYRHKGKNRILFENVPAGVCKLCGSRYFSANVLKMLDRLYKKSPGKKEFAHVPLVHFN